MTEQQIDAPNVMRGLLLKYGPPAGPLGPEKFVTDMWNVTPDAWQQEGLRAYGAGVRGISIRSAHGVGKTAYDAWCATIQLYTRFPQKTVITAPSAGQLFDALYAEMVSWIQQLPPVLQDLVNITATRIELRAAPKDSFVSFRTARAESPEALQGVHSEHVLLIADEASGVPEPIFESAIGSMSGHNATTILSSNPTRTTGFFYDSQTHPELADRWHRIHVNGLESPRVSQDFVDSVRLTYGENSNAYRIRVLGEFPVGDTDTVIPRDLVEASFDRDIGTIGAVNEDEIWGVDVARFGQDSSVLVKRRGPVTHDIIEWRGLDTMQTVGRIHDEYKSTNVDRRPQLILVDVIGLGAGVVDRLRELGLPVRGINTSESPSSGDKYLNLRSELWFKGREWFEQREGRIIDDGRGRKLADQLCAPTYDYTSAGKLQVESKKSMRKRGLDSPNIADAFLLTLAAPASKMIHGRRIGFGTPLNHTLKRVV